jgi:hypothetical protein
MKNPGNVTWGAVFLAVVLLVLGTEFIFRPATTPVPHVQTPTKGGVPKMDFVEPITPGKSRIYGALAISFGIGLLWIYFIGGRAAESR